MNHDMYAKVANDICDNLINLCLKNKIQNKSLIELFDKLLDEKYSDYRLNILSYIPEQLAKKGYEIVDTNKFEIKKY